MTATLFTDDAAFQIAARYFRLPVMSVRPWSFGNVEISPPTDHKRAVLSLREARQRMEHMASDATASVEQYLDADAKLLNAHRAEAMFDAGFFVAEGTFDLPAAGQGGVDQLRSVEQSRRIESLRFLDRFEDMIRIRMSTSIRLLRLRHIIDSVATGTVKEPTGPTGVSRFVTRVHTALFAMDQARGQFETLRNVFAEAYILLFNLSSQPTNQNLIAQAHPRVTQIHDELVRLRVHFEQTLYPFDGGSEESTREAAEPQSMAAFLLPDLAPIARVDQLMLQAEQWLNSFAYLHHRLLAHLAAICAKVELAVGLPPLPRVSSSKVSTPTH